MRSGAIARPEYHWRACVHWNLRRLVALFSGALLLAADPAYREALPGQPYSFPRDHFEHPGYRTEWWYYTGNLRDGSGRAYGFELVFFRQGVRRGASENASAWRIDDAYLAHAAVTDVSSGKFIYRERLNRAGPGIAGASFDARRIWNGNWSAQWRGEKQEIACVTDEFSFRLALAPEKPFVIHGVNGVSQKAEGRGRASRYVSFTRLKTTGEISLAGGQRTVTGQAWMDHEWFTEQLAPEQAGWDWFSVQLDNGVDLMLFDLRRKDGTIDPYSSGTFVDREGRAQHLTSREFTLRPVNYWSSPTTHAKYPISWDIAIPKLQISIRCSALIPAQELSTSRGGNSYWEGAVKYEGSHTGKGYLEMTGYASPVSFEGLK